MHLVYVLYFDDESRREAVDVFGGLPYTRPHFIRTTRYLENVMYLEELPGRRDEWEGTAFVGCISYRAARKGLTPDALHHTVMTNDAGSSDVVAFMTLSVPMYSHATKHHPRFMEIWTALLVGLGYTREVATKDNIIPFVCNYWLARPEWMARYIPFQQRARDLIEGDPALREIMDTDSTYEGAMPVETMRAVFGKDYYPYYPFVMERLPCFFFQHHGAKIFYRYNAV